MKTNFEINFDLFERNEKTLFLKVNQLFSLQMVVIIWYNQSITHPSHCTHRNTVVEKCLWNISNMFLLLLSGSFTSHELDCVDHSFNGERSYYVCCSLHSPPTLNVIVLRQERACALFLSLNLANITAIEIDTQLHRYLNTTTERTGKDETWMYNPSPWIQLCRQKHLNWSIKMTNLTL